MIPMTTAVRPMYVRKPDTYKVAKISAASNGQMNRRPRQQRGQQGNASSTHTDTFTRLVKVCLSGED